MKYDCVAKTTVMETFTKVPLVSQNKQVINQCNVILKHNINNFAILVPCSAEELTLPIKMGHVN
jgi:hypothetical protein